MSTESLDIAALKELCEKATPGPWETREASTPGYVPHYGVGSPRFTFPDVVYAHSDWEGYGNGSRKADADFIAAARSAVPTLITEVERLQGALDDVRELTQRAFETLHAPYTLTPFDLGHIDRDLREIERILASFDADHTDTKEQDSE